MRTGLFLAVAALVLAGCNTKEKYAANNAAAWAWVQSHTQTPQIDVIGAWQSEAWGAAQFAQSGRSITGKLGDYNVHGRVSGSRAYVLLESDGWIYYTAVLARPNAWTLRGFYSSEVPFREEDQEEIELRKVRP